MSKYHLQCSCVKCKKVLSGQNLKHHSVICGIPKRLCKQCNSPIYKITNKFCCRSCAAIYNNARKDYTQIKTGPSKKPKVKKPNPSRDKTHFINYTNVKRCVICDNYHVGQGKTCSIQCKSKLISKSIKQRIYDGYNPQVNRGRGKQSYLESSFEHWLIINNVTNYISEHPVKRTDVVKTYFLDFYFPLLNVAIELDGTQHNTLAAQIYDKERDSCILQQHNITIKRITHSEYISKTKIQEIGALLEIRTPIS